MQTGKIPTEINATMDELMQLLSSIENEQIDVIPFDGSWTAGQLAKHIIMSGSGFLQILHGPVKDTERAPDGLVEKIKGDFLNFDNKMNSPAFIVPEYKKYDKEELLHSIQEIKSGLGEAFETLDLSKTCLAFELPGYGYLTRLEAISFILYHTKRHIHQLKNIIANLAAPKKIHKTI